MKLNYKMWNTIDTPREFKKSPYIRFFEKAVYFDNDYVVATQGNMLVAIPKETAFYQFDAEMYQKMIGKGISYEVSKEIFKNNFTIENEQIKMGNGICYPFVDSEGAKYPNWKAVIPGNERITDTCKLALDPDKLKRICDAVDCIVPVLLFTSNGILIKENSNEPDNGVIALLMQYNLAEQFRKIEPVAKNVEPVAA